MRTETQFALVSVGRLAYLVHHYEAMRIDAVYLPPDPSRPSLAYIDTILSELRRELRLREDATSPALVSL